MKTDITTCPTYWVRIYISGPLAVIEHTCRCVCMDVGLCVTVDATKFVYTGGEESGAVIGLVNYPRFQRSYLEIDRLAHNLATRLILETHQLTALVVTPQKTYRLKRAMEGAE